MAALTTDSINVKAHQGSAHQQVLVAGESANYYKGAVLLVRVDTGRAYRGSIDSEEGYFGGLVLSGGSVAAGGEIVAATGGTWLIKYTGGTAADVGNYLCLPFDGSATDNPNDLALEPTDGSVLGPRVGLIEAWDAAAGAAWVRLMPGATAGGSATTGRPAEERVITLAIHLDGGTTLATEVLTAADDSAGEANLYSGMDSTVTPLLWKITHGAVTAGPFLVGDTITGGLSGETAEVVTVASGYLIVQSWSGGAWTAAETLTGTGGASAAFSAVTGYANAHGFLTGIATRATDANLYYEGANANNVAPFGGVASVGLNKTGTAWFARLASRGATAGWALSFADAATGAAYAVNATNFGTAGLNAVVHLHFYARD